MSKDNIILDKITNSDYKYGFSSKIYSDELPKGINEFIIRLISKKKKEPQWLLKWRLKAYNYWILLKEPIWVNVKYNFIDYQSIIYYSAPKNQDGNQDTDLEIKNTFNKLGISLDKNQDSFSNIAMDVILDSVSVSTTFHKKLKKLGIVFCSFSDAVQIYPNLIKKYIGSVVPISDNYFAALNSAIFSDGSFCYIPKGIRCPMELSTYFRINAVNTGQFERTLIVAEEGSYVSYLEGCTAPERDENQLHAAVVEIYIKKNAEVKYSTIQNWYPGDKDGNGGIYNFVTKRGICAGDYSKLSWIQVETGSAITWKYPSCILKGDSSRGEFYSIAITNNRQQADTGTKMIHIGKNTKSRIISKGISAGKSQNSYRGLVQVINTAINSRNFSQCDSLLIGNKCGAHTFPYIEVYNNNSIIEHEASTSKIEEDQLFYCNQRGIDLEKAVSLIINGYCKEVLKNLPLEFALEAQQLLSLTLEGSVG